MEFIFAFITITIILALFLVGLNLMKNGTIEDNNAKKYGAFFVAFCMLLFAKIFPRIPSWTEEGSKAKELKSEYEEYNKAIEIYELNEESISEKFYNKLKEHNDAVDDIDETIWVKFMGFDKESYKIDLENCVIDENKNSATDISENEKTEPENSTERDEETIKINGKYYKLEPIDTGD